MSAPPASELTDACARWGISGAAIEYEVDEAQIAAWLRSYGEAIPPCGLDEPVSWTGRTDGRRPTWRQLWALRKRRDAGETLEDLAAERGVATTTLSTWLQRLASHYGGQAESDPEPVEESPPQPEPTPAPDTPHEWQALCHLATQDGAPSPKTLGGRARYSGQKWAHYERTPLEDAGIIADGRATYAYRLRPGTTWAPMGQQEKDTEEHVMVMIENIESIDGADEIVWRSSNDWEGRAGAPTCRTIVNRARSEAARWAHYLEVDTQATAHDPPGRVKAHPATRYLYALRPGTTWDALEVGRDDEGPPAPHRWDSAAALGKLDDAPAPKTIKVRAEGDDLEWAHYEVAPAEEVAGDWHRLTTHVYRLREGTTWGPHGEDDPEDALRAQVDDLEASLEDAARYCDERDDRIEALEAALSEATSTRDKALDRLQARAQTAEERLADADRAHQAEVDELRSELKSQHAHAVSERSKLRFQLQAAEREAAERRSELEALREQAVQWRDERDQARDEYEQLRERHVALKTKHDQMRHERRGYEQDTHLIERLRGEMEAQRGEVRQLRQRLAEERRAGHEDVVELVCLERELEQDLGDALEALRQIEARGEQLPLVAYRALYRARRREDDGEEVDQ